MASVNISYPQCERCGAVLELCPARFPWHDDFWICPQCDSTFSYENEKDEHQPEE